MKRYSKEEKRMWVEDWRQSRTSLYAYAKTSGISLGTLKNWAKETESPQGFVEITPQLPVLMGHGPEILIEKGDIRIHLPIEIRRSDLQVVIQSLESGVMWSDKP